MANATLGPCPHCGQQHAEDVLLCPTTERLIPLQGRILDGKFRFDKMLGEGGMGAVWRAENILVKKNVAIKLMHVQFSRDEGVLARFRNEATAAGRIGSKHICDILDLGRSQLGPYIVMEMLQGSDFADFIVKRQGRVEPGVTVMIVRQALVGLAAAHGKGIVHRDLKPENIFLHEPEPGRLLVKLMDFGISKFTEGENAGKTGMGVLMGTPEYMSPEQTEGAAQVDARTDIWAMGVILYWALAGRNPFVGQTLAATLMNVAARDPAPLDQVAPHLAPGLVAVINRCVRKRPDERYASAQELYEALAPFENLTGSPWMPASATAMTTSPPPVPTPAPAAMPLGATVVGGPSQVGATAIASSPPPMSPGMPSMAPPPKGPMAPMAPPMAPPMATPMAGSAPTFGTQGTPAATGPTWSNELPTAGKAAPTIGGFGSFDGVEDDSRRPDRNIGGGGGKGILIGVLGVALVAAAGTGWYVFKNKQAGETKSDVVVAGDTKDSGGEAKDTAGEAKDTAGEAKDSAGEAKDTAGEAKDTAGDTKTDTAGDTKTDTAGDTKTDTAGDTKTDTAGDTKDSGGDTKADTAGGGDAGNDTADPSGGTPDPSGGTPDPSGGTPDPSGGDPDPSGGTPDPTGGGGNTDPKPKPKAPDLTKVRVVGSLYVAKPARPAGSFDAVKSECSSKASSKYGHVKGWRPMKESEAKAVAGSVKAWIDTGKIWNGASAALAPKSGRASYAAFCVAKK